MAKRALISTTSKTFSVVSVELLVDATSNPSTLYADCSGFSTWNKMSVNFPIPITIRAVKRTVYYFIYFKTIHNFGKYIRRITRVFKKNLKLQIFLRL